MRNNSWSDRENKMFCLNASYICLPSPTLFQEMLSFQTRTPAVFFCQSFVAKTRLESMRSISLGQIIPCLWSLKFISNLNFFRKALLQTRHHHRSSWQDLQSGKPHLFSPPSLQTPLRNWGLREEVTYVLTQPLFCLLNSSFCLSFSCYDFTLTVNLWEAGLWLTKDCWLIP